MKFTVYASSPPLDKQGITSMDKDRMTFSQVNLLLNMGVSMVPQ